MALPFPAPRPDKKNGPPQSGPPQQSKKLPRAVTGGAFLGILLLTAAAIAGTAFFFMPRRNRAGVWDGESFRQDLALFDGLLKEAGLEKTENVNRALDRLDRKALGLESRLSVLKRRRLLARQDPRFIPAYQKSAEQSARAIPFSEPLAAIAAESLLMGAEEGSEKEGIEKNAGRIRGYAGILTESKLRPLSLGLRVLLGDLQDPERANSIPHKEALYSASVPGQGLGLTVDLIILRILNNDLPAASYQINSLLAGPGARNPGITRFAAEFFYDFGNPSRAAELFSRSSDEYSISRQADALWLSGRVSGARNLWAALLSPDAGAWGEKGGNSVSPAVKARALYNLAAAAGNPAEKAAGLTRFLLETEADSAYRAYGAISYARLLDEEQGPAFLEGEPSGNSLVGLELLRRQEEAWPLEKMIAETWLLVNRYPQDSRVYQWGCYFFDHQRRYEEAARLIAQAGHYHINTPSLVLHESLRLIRDGLLDEAETRLSGIDGSIWQVPANMGRIREIRRNFGSALAYYQAAADLAVQNKDEASQEAKKDRRNAANIYYSISRCFRALGQEAKSLEALEQALKFDPHYLNARLSLERAAP
ncbi:MAG: tetratricopeptide repeat protein [Spirochaetaceae bacterium]|jgi:tetratricopeptide (TPR) repeat protein|nr:tetratricopeptide repeat protein [Spirochaetaceae bacterium]